MLFIFLILSEENVFYSTINLVRTRVIPPGRCIYAVVSRSSPGPWQTPTFPLVIFCAIFLIFNIFQAGFLHRDLDRIEQYLTNHLCC